LTTKDFFCFLPSSLDEPGARFFATIATFKVGQMGNFLHNVRTQRGTFVKLENARGGIKYLLNNIIHFVSCI
jgi:hypothetical protein